MTDIFLSVNLQKWICTPARLLVPWLPEALWLIRRELQRSCIVPFVGGYTSHEDGGGPSHETSTCNEFRVVRIISRLGSTDVNELRWALYTTEGYPRIVRLATLLKPVIPVIAPFAACLKCRWQPRATAPLITASVVLFAVKITRAVLRKLPSTTIVKDALTSPRDLNVEAVLSFYVITDVGDLHNHGLVHQVWMSTSPVSGRMLLVNKAQLEALATVCITSETM